jgi:hypothetical protein
VFRLYDTRARQLEEIVPGPGRLLRLYAHAPAPHAAAHAGDLRTLLLADLIRRNAEHRHGASVLGCLVVAEAGLEAGTGDGAGTGTGTGDAAELNLRPAEQTLRAPEFAGPAGGVIAPGEVLISTAGREARWHSVRAGPVTFGGRELTEAAVRLADLADRGLDPLALRLALASRRYAGPVDLTWDALSDADQALCRWRRLVAGWAESPSKPMNHEVAARVAAAFDSDLDTPAALQALDQLAQDPQIPPGSKLETFLDADQLLALDLPRDIGRAP